MRLKVQATQKVYVKAGFSLLQRHFSDLNRKKQSVTKQSESLNLHLITQGLFHMIYRLNSTTLTRRHKTVTRNVKTYESLNRLFLYCNWRIIGRQKKSNLIKQEDDKGHAWQPRGLKKMLLTGWPRLKQVSEAISFERLQPKKLKRLDPGRPQNSKRQRPNLLYVPKYGWKQNV